ncbi:hypothetical protein EVC26_059 [Rhizobium phage RHph_I72]|nr:hypothetical protein EVC13_057 [Rhizobium phage RHph_I65]QIG76505.1 hypothetical protein EVC26_059 [Rhizobium phage RHph_I72]
MPYVLRNENGVIISSAGDPLESWPVEYLEPDDPEYLAFLQSLIPPYSIPADLPWVRMTDAEAELVNGGFSVRTRNSTLASIAFVFGSDAFNTFHGVISTALSPSRADEIMAQMQAL